ncbi:helix-turn-helix transcriptional regulator [Aliikangiella coralliicola]|uniref:HTH domain-containing protein n=1 Tax=Aliikangiella coralliicola TaxID=2592383 RepID=A0A545UJ24_9GAMM|nr:HTH domain-containing protein [Aliikangiella coralliicola]TQV89467.1 HTH domain-containing protein [Aliikangiella coralliicola]
MKTSDKIIQLLKKQGALTAKTLAGELDLTTMGVRQHMLALEQSGEVIFEDKKAPRGRPTRYWSLTEKSNVHFADGHEGLTLQLIDSVKTVFGDSGLEQLIEHRERESQKLYFEAMKDKKDLLSKLEVLAVLRSEEGYMATVIQEADFYWLIEDHCPICAAASHCLNFCRSELSLFQALLEDVASVSREEHIVEGARRCAYKVSPL